MKSLVFLLALVGLTMSINQTCPCPVNAYCLDNDLCACNPGFIGNCSIPAIYLTSQNLTINLTMGYTMLLIVMPDQLEVQLEFTLNFCLPTDTNITFYLWAQTGTINIYNAIDTFVYPITGNYVEGCQQVTSPYVTFGHQSNGLGAFMVLGMQPVPQKIVQFLRGDTVQVVINVTQQVTVNNSSPDPSPDSPDPSPNPSTPTPTPQSDQPAYHPKYFIIFGSIVLVGIIIVAGVGIFLWKKKKAELNETVAEPAQNTQKKVVNLQSHIPEHIQESRPQTMPRNDQIYRRQSKQQQQSIPPVAPGQGKHGIRESML